jgi:hypothetical protein
MVSSAGTVSLSRGGQSLQVWPGYPEVVSLPHKWSVCPAMVSLPRDGQSAQRWLVCSGMPRSLSRLCQAPGDTELGPLRHIPQWSQNLLRAGPGPELTEMLQ